MIICLYGPDAFRRREKLKAITAEYVKKHSALSVQSFDLADAEGFQKFSDSVSARSLFDPFRFISVLNAFSIPDNEVARYAAVLRSMIGEKQVVVALCADGAPPKALEFLLEKPATSQEFSILEGAKVLQLVKNEAQKLGFSPAVADLSHVAGVCGGDGFCIANELRKLAAGGALETQLVYKREPFFEAVMGLRRANSPVGKLPVLEVLLAREDAAAVFNMLAALVSENEKSRFADYDVAIKSGKLDYEAVLTDYSLG